MKIKTKALMKIIFLQKKLFIFNNVDIYIKKLFLTIIFKNLKCRRRIKTF